jgi:cell division septum initiation protein DivIVA
MEQYLIERIIGDANDEAKEILSAAKANAKENVAYATEQAAKIVEEAKKAAANRQKHQTEITESEKQIARNIAELRGRTAVINDVFTSAMDSIKYNWRVDKHPTYELRLTRPALEMELRENIEKDVVKILFGEV